MANSDLGQAREKIDEIDEKILELLLDRFGIAEHIARYKMENGLPVLDEQREQLVIDRRTQFARDLGLPEGTRDLFTVVMRMSRARQSEMLAQWGREHDHAHIAAFQGVPGANSHLALVELLGEDIASKPFASFADVFSAVEKGDVTYGVLPIENSYTGSVMQVYDLLGKFAVSIIGEKSMAISHALVALPGAKLEDIRTVYSHEQALMQCAPFFEEHPWLHQEPFYNTAGAAQFVAESKDAHIAAFANPYAAKLYGLEVLVPEASASKENTTRFLLIANRPYQGSDANKASVRFTLSHAPGTLAQALEHFASFDLNMVKIESRPLRDRNFEYSFYVDFEGKDVSPNVRRALEIDATIFADVRILGIYRIQ